MERYGDINFKLEDLVEFLRDNEKLSDNQILHLAYLELQNYPENQEEYLDGTRPEYTNIPCRKKIKSKKGKSKLKQLIKKYIKEQDMQWHEVLYAFFGYMISHRERIDGDDLLLKFKYGVI